MFIEKGKNIMKKYLLVALLMLALVVTAVACDKTPDEPADTTDAATTEAPTEDATTEAPAEDATTEAPTEDATAETPTEEPTVETPTEEPTTEEPATEEPTTEEPTTEEPTEPAAPRYEDYEPSIHDWTVSGHRPAIQDSTDGMVAAGGLEYGALLHQGAISLGEIDLSKYEKVIVYCGCDASDVTQGRYDANAMNRIIISKVDTHGVMSPNEEDIIASVTYTLHGWAPEAVEIDLSGIDYNGPVYVTYDTLPGTFMLVGAIEFIGAEMPAPAEPVEIDLSTVTSTGNYPDVDVPVPGSVFGTDHCFALHYGSINLGEIDLSRYSKVIVTYATPDDATVPGASDQYNMTGKRVLLLNAPSASQGTFEYLPEESAIITSTQYEMSPASLTTTTVEIDLTNVTYNGTVYLTFDYRDAENGQAANGFLVWVTGISLA